MLALEPDGADVVRDVEARGFTESQEIDHGKDRDEVTLLRSTQFETIDEDDEAVSDDSNNDTYTQKYGARNQGLGQFGVPRDDPGILFRDVCHN